MRIQHNVAALNVYNNMSQTTAKMQKTYEKLSSGYAINRAADDAAGLAISEKMRGQISGLEQASDNIQDGLSLVQVAEAGLGQISNPNLVRMRELAVQAANDTLTDEDRALIQKEVEQIKEGINDIANNTEFNTIPLLNQMSATRGTAAIETGSYIANKYIIALNVSNDGSFDLRTNEGYPNTNNDDNQILNYGQGSTTQPSLLMRDAQGNVQQYDLKSAATNIRTEKVGDAFQTVYQLPNDIEVKQTVRLKEAKFEFVYEMKNNGTSEANVGFQFHMDTMLGNDDSAPFNVDHNAVSKGKIFSGTSLPNMFDVYNNAGNPDIKAEGVLTGTDILVSPDELRIGYFGDVRGYNFTEGNDVGDSGYALVWNPTTLAAGATKTVNTFYGLGIPPTSTNTEVWTNPEIEDKDLILQVGPNEGQTFKVRLTDARTQTLGINEVDLTTREGAERAIASIDNASKYVSTERSKFGAYMNALEHISNNVSNYTVALSSAESRIRDTDIAEQMTNLTKDQVVLQSAQSMMAQVNQMSQGILQLLK